jgi:hypothetical protein
MKPRRKKPIRLRTKPSRKSVWNKDEPNPLGILGIAAPWLSGDKRAELAGRLVADEQQKIPDWMGRVNPAPILQTRPIQPATGKDSHADLIKRPGPRSAKMDSIWNYVRANERNILRRLKRSNTLPSRRQIAIDIGIALGLQRSNLEKPDAEIMRVLRSLTMSKVLRKKRSKAGRN